MSWRPPPTSVVLPLVPHCADWSSHPPSGPPVLGRRHEIARLLYEVSLARSVIIVGAAGIGKTQVLRGLAAALRREDPRAETWYCLLDQHAESRIEEVMRATRKRTRQIGFRKIVLLIDNGDILFTQSAPPHHPPPSVSPPPPFTSPAAGPECPADMASIVQRAVVRAQGTGLSVIIAISDTVYEQKVKHLTVFLSHFKRVGLREMKPADTMEVLRQFATSLRDVHVTDSALEAAVTLSHRTRPSPTRYQPVPALRLLLATCHQVTSKYAAPSASASADLAPVIDASHVVEQAQIQAQALEQAPPS